MVLAASDGLLLTVVPVANSSERHRRPAVETSRSGGATASMTSAEAVGSGGTAASTSFKSSCRRPSNQATSGGALRPQAKGAVGVDDSSTGARHAVDTDHLATLLNKELLSLYCRAPHMPIIRSAALVAPDTVVFAEVLAHAGWSWRRKFYGGTAPVRPRPPHR